MSIPAKSNDINGVGFKRRSFLLGLAASAPSVAISGRVASQANPVCDALVALAAALDEEANGGEWRAFFSLDDNQSPFLNVLIEGEQRSFAPQAEGGMV